MHHQGSTDNILFSPNPSVSIIFLHLVHQPNREAEINKRQMSDEMNQREDIFSKVVRAGKRTYFFDVRTTRGNDLYLTITESKKRYNDDGKFFFQKHKIFLYKEHSEKFADGFTETIDKIKSLQGTGDYSDYSPMDRQESTDTESSTEAPKDETVPEETKKEKVDSEFTDVSFDDLGEE